MEEEEDGHAHIRPMRLIQMNEKKKERSSRKLPYFHLIFYLQLFMLLVFSLLLYKKIFQASVAELIFPLETSVFN